MSQHEEPQVVPEGVYNTLQTNITNESTQKRTNNINKDEQSKYSKDLQSRFGVAFLPYASQLESVEKNRTIRKRKGKNKRKKPVQIATITQQLKDNKQKKIKYDKHREINNNKIQQKIGAAKKKHNKEINKLEWQGDVMTFDEGWPNIENKKTLRIFHINLNGVTYQNNLMEWEMTIAYLMDMQVDIFGLTEINLDLNNGIIRDKVIQSGKHFDPYIRMATSSSLQKVGPSPFKMGGTITGTNGCWSGRITKQGSDELGRWSYMAIQSKQGKQVIIITVYVPNKPTTAGGGTTIYSQMEADIVHKKGKLMEPRKELLKDLYNFIEKEKNKGNTIFLMGDMNDTLGIDDSQINQFLQSLDMSITYKIRHGEEAVLPPTHDRGSNCLDMIGCSNHVEDTAIVRAGYAPFYFNFFTDHRGVYIDIDIDSLFNSTRPDTTRPIYKRFTTLHVPKCSKYLLKLEELMEKSKIFQQIDELEEEYEEYAENKDNETRERIIKATKTLFEKVTEFMKRAERWAGPVPYRDGFPDSPQLRRVAFKVIRIKKYLRLISLGTIEANEVEKIRATKDLKNAQRELRETQKSANILRQAHLEILANKRSHQWQMSSSEALHIINESEKSKRVHGKHRRLLNKDNEGTLRSLMIPTPTTGLVNNIKDTRLYTTITDSTTMFNILLKRNFNHLIQSNDSMFTKGMLLDKCGWYGKEEGMEEILQGMLNAEEIEDLYPEYGKEGVEFIKALRYTTDGKGEKTKPFKWKFGSEEFMEVFNKTRESTACGPSGLHMSHWKAACERKEIARVHAFFMWAAFELGFSYERWENSWHCMIKKLKQPLLPKLRIVQLFEGDFNACLKYLIGRKMMSHMNKKELHDQETFGSRTGKTAPEALVNLQLLFDHNRIWRLPTAIIFNDAIGCYDRIVPTLCELAMRARGCPKGIAQCHTITQKGMKHRIRIASGISEGIIKFAEKNKVTKEGKVLLCIEGRTGGIGQGGGAGPLSWIAVIDVMLEAYRNLCPGAKAIDPMMIYSLCYWLISYVDDNTIVTGFNDNTSQNEILNTIKSNLGSWRRLLQLTGGDIDVVKSKWCVMRWKYNEVWGQQTIEQENDFPGEVGMKTVAEGVETTQLLERLEPHQAERVLGVRVPMDGNMNMEYEFRTEQIKELSKKIFAAPINQWDAWLIYESRYRSIIRYPLPVTMFTRKQCDKIQKPFVNAILPKMGVNRNTPRAVIYGPKSMGGLEIMDLRVEQAAAQWDTTSGHLRRMDRAGKGLHITANDTQIETGSSIPFYDLDPELCTYTTENTRWNYLWKTIHSMDLKMNIYDFWTPQQKTASDRNIMDTAMHDDILKRSKWPIITHINRCRLYVKAVFISDLTNDGINIDTGYLDGTIRGKNDILEIPDIRCPTKRQWGQWRSFIHRNFLSPGLRINPPLGEVNEKRATPQLPDSDTRKMLNIVPNEMGIRELIDLLPQSLRQSIGEVDIPEDGGVLIGESIIDGTCVGASDGSLIRENNNCRGSHGYALRVDNDEKDDIKGWGPSPDSDDMSSMTTEHYGLMGILVLLHLICKRFKIGSNESFGKVTIYIDNKTVVTRGQIKQELINLSDYHVPDQDLWSTTTELINALPIVVSLKWVRGHQDTNEFGEKINGPFKQDVMLNILVDKLARKGMELGKGKVTKKPTQATTAIALYDSNNRQITDLRKYMVQRINGNELKEYTMKKKGWNERVMTSIEWEGIEKMMKSAPPLRRTKLIQLLHNWQNTGRQKGIFRDSRIKIGTEVPLEPTTEETHCHKCPDGCEEEESDLHFLECPTIHARRRRKTSIKTVLRRLKCLHTYEGITSYIGYILTRISEREEMDFDWDEIEQDGNMSLRIALTGQEEIGWSRLCQGFFHRGWTEIQRKHYRRSGKNSKILNIGRWKKMFSTILADYSLECWRMRNETLHGKEVDETRKTQLSKVKKQIKQLYGKKEILRGTSQFRIYDMPLKKRLGMGIQSSRIWVGMAEEVLRLQREKATKNTLHHWLQP